MGDSVTERLRVAQPQTLCLVGITGHWLMPLAVAVAEWRKQAGYTAGAGMTTADSGMGRRRIARPLSGLAGTGSLTPMRVG